VILRPNKRTFWLLHKKGGGAPMYITAFLFYTR